ncbi:MAG TPA: Smr/MutS family protein [Steroidobacteraceae bacterium]
MKRISDEDAELFRAAVRDVKPLAPGPRVPAVKKVPGRARFTRADRQAVLQESLEGPIGDDAVSGGDELVFRRAGVQPLVVRNLRRGLYRVEAEFDLHGLNVTQAKTALTAFLNEALARDYRCVRIVHGKGLRSGTRGPVLKNVVSNVLRRIVTVVAFVSARPMDGGTGALYVLLSR